MSLSKDLCERLASPFPPESIKWKIQTNPKGQLAERDGKKYGFARVVVYLDARDVAERLDEVLPGQWSSSYKIIHPNPNNLGKLSDYCDLVVVECSLMIEDIVRSDVGEGNDFKTAYSDGLKRAAVQLGVARFLYRFPQVKAEVVNYGDAFYLTPSAERELMLLNTAIISGDIKLPKFDKIQIHGYIPIVSQEGLI